MRIKINKLFILGLVIFSFMGIGLSLIFDYQRLNSEFKYDVSLINHTFIQQMSSIETVLISLAGLHHASDNLNEAELSSFSSAMLKAYPYISAIITMEKTELNDYKNFELRMHEKGYINLKLKKPSMHKNTAKNNFYLPVNFVEPMTPVSASMLGLDIYSLPYMPDIINLSIANGKVVASKISKFTIFNKSYIFMFKALYLGRYPPTTAEDRLTMLDGIVALKIDEKYFMNFLNLKNHNLNGDIKSINISIFSKNNQKTVDYNISLNKLSFIENFRAYDQNYRFTLERKITFSMLSKQHIFFFWLTFMFLFFLLLFINKKRKISKAEIEYLAYYDPLTTLPNRTSFKESLKQAINEAAENNTIGAVLFMDIDEFKRINDTLGHDVGDELLKQVSQRMTQHMRQGETFGPVSRLKIKDIVTRLGGDEFTVILTNIHSIDSVEVVASRILQHISQAFYLNGHEVHVTSSIGIAIYPRDGDGVDELLKHADTAMYHAKDTGKNNYQLYHKSMSLQIEKRLNLEEKLHQALDKNEFQLYYQPQIDVKSNKIIAAEALIRWNQSELGMVYPDDFIPLAEETGQIIQIGEWVIKEACKQNKAWQLAGYSPIRVAVNLSSLQFLQDDLYAQINYILNETQLNPKYLELEITESIMMKNIEKTISIINTFTEMNIDVSVDDFGTGYSSLNYLKKFPLKSLKIDKSFVQDIPEDEDDMMITTAIISMAKSLNLKVTAEGVETASQVSFLKERHCDMMQGYYFSRPVPADEFEKLLSNQKNLR